MCYGRNSRRPAKLPNEVNGGGRGIRTPGTLSGTAVFKTACFNRSHIPPRMILSVREWRVAVSLQALFGASVRHLSVSRAHRTCGNSPLNGANKENVCKEFC